ncbi:putative dehydrogenase [Saonia flava]|uniref:Putative dehydrogenase n=1 Tax=Saonia flava TaxID=523696 RepID=A0A846R084_9FLAO|nr:Gfo/Idh/MocA family oxidoreductase [Saonia flava]NJB71325.1 putative dehydrogenase [Saonia flava]
MNNNKTRRSFLKKAALGSAAITSTPYIYASSYKEELFLERIYEKREYSANDQINLALIGSGIQGIYDTTSALKVNGVKLVAACDLYTGRLDRAKELWGEGLFVTRDYRKILDRKDVDAVIVAVPDHWHKRITIDAMKAGKAVYCEKPMVQNFEEGHEIIKVQKDTGIICQVGSQGMSSLGNEKAKQLYEDGAIGEMVMLDMYNDRYSSEGAWQYPVPPDANPNTIDFDAFLGRAPKVPYDATRFFRWRNYKDYGTGVAGDLFVHAFSTLNFILSSDGPNRALSTGGLRYWKDGRDVPDVTLTFYDYPETKTHAAFNASFRVNFIAGSGGGGGFRLVGTEGEMEVSSNSVKLTRSKLGMTPSSYSLIAYTEENQKKILKAHSLANPENRKSELNIGETTYKAPSDYKGGHYDHFYNFFQGIRGKKEIIENPTFGLRAAGAALLANESYYQGKPINWDPKSMKLL